ncbi:hypothetical protein [Lacticaseibacillus rhamnosus]|uniref:hypothetical protein n=1 Tax=Lacticaseibacillus rhamnosus TaxID=47715 RepID=UPI000629ED22|nr:hypothetical protein [Lacticaseibacillus rhamnosus]KKW88386.1 hypothetical protein XA20_04485 [Lacticaseibacillus rhamnosus]
MEREPARLEVGVQVASDVMAALWPLRPRSLHADFCAGERVMEREPARVEVGVSTTLTMMAGP